MITSSVAASATPVASYVHIMFKAVHKYKKKPRQINSWQAMKEDIHGLNESQCSKDTFIHYWLDYNDPSINPLLHDPIPYPINRTFDLGEYGDLGDYTDCSYGGPKNQNEGAGMLVCAGGDFMNDCVPDTDPKLVCPKLSLLSGRPRSVSFWPKVKCACAWS